MEYFKNVHFEVGDRINHPAWGVGTVVEDSGHDSTLVEFDKETDYGFIVGVSSVLCVKYED